MTMEVFMALLENGFMFTVGIILLVVFVKSWLTTLRDISDGLRLNTEVLKMHCQDTGNSLDIIKRSLERLDK